MLKSRSLIRLSWDAEGQSVPQFVDFSSNLSTFWNNPWPSICPAPEKGTHQSHTSHCSPFSKNLKIFPFLDKKNSTFGCSISEDRGGIS